LIYLVHKIDLNFTEIFNTLPYELFAQIILDDLEFWKKKLRT
jgi:hypothetical protein